MRYVQDAVPGSEETGFSEALVGIDGEWRGINVTAMEKQVIDFDSTYQRRSTLPGVGTGTSRDRILGDRTTNNV